MLFFLLKSIILVICVLISVAYSTLFERKVIASIQRRKGPNVVGVFGLLQPLADGLKLLIKESFVPYNANKYLFILAPIFTFFLSFVTWLVIPFSKGVVFFDVSLGVLYLLSISSLAVYGIIISGWSSNSKYAFLGGMRSTAQMISYEVFIGIVVLIIVLVSNSFNLFDIVKQQCYYWNILLFFPIAFIFFISGLAETNRAPFDLPEAEAELVAGYNVEYASMGFALFFLGEYANMLLMSALFSILFLGGWFLPFCILSSYSFINIFVFSLKITIVMFLFILVRAAFPRFRYDQLMRLGWKIFLPFTLAWLYFMLIFFFLFDF